MSERKRKLDLSSDGGEKAPPAKMSKSVETAVNPLTQLPYSKQYYEILEKRKALPVWDRNNEFCELLAAHQVLILQGETGSGKTTQVRVYFGKTASGKFFRFLQACHCKFFSKRVPQSGFASMLP
jgi:HrpA-like RNA helicase